jgi:hypothetical protein
LNEFAEFSDGGKDIDPITTPLGRPARFILGQ